MLTDPETEPVIWSLDDPIEMLKLLAVMKNLRELGARTVVWSCIYLYYILYISCIVYALYDDGGQTEWPVRHGNRRRLNLTRSFHVTRHHSRALW